MNVDIQAAAFIQAKDKRHRVGAVEPKPQEQRKRPLTFRNKLMDCNYASDGIRVSNLKNVWMTRPSIFANMLVINDLQIKTKRPLSRNIVSRLAKDQKSSAKTENKPVIKAGYKIEGGNVVREYERREPSQLAYRNDNYNAKSMMSAEKIRLAIIQDEEEDENFKQNKKNKEKDKIQQGIDLLKVSGWNEV